MEYGFCAVALISCSCMFPVCLKDERIKYSKSELLRIRAGVHSALSFSEIEVSLPESLVKSGSK